MATSSENKIIVPAINRTAALGRLYDANSDTFELGTIFNNDTLLATTPGLMTVTEMPSSQTKIVQNESLADKLDLLSVEAELKVSILGGLIEVGGAGKYLSDTKSSKKAFTATMLTTISTVNQTFNIHNKALHPLINTECLSNTNATHFVGGIDWGGKAVLTLTYSNTENFSKSELEG